ncbi:hypothetical protein Hanom_Chr00s000002g01600971 [Helianthus anomalus]
MRFGWFEKLLLYPFLISVLFFKCLFFYASCEIKHRWTRWPDPVTLNVSKGSLSFFTKVESE